MSEEIKQEETQAAEQGTEQSGDEIKVNEATDESKKGALATLADIEQEVEKAFERFFRGGWLPSLKEMPPFPAIRETLESRLPKVDIIDRDDQIIVNAELPGVKKADVDVSVSSDTLTIKATSSREEKVEEDDYHRQEISRGFFSRTVKLPAAIDAGQSNASFEDGMLTVTLPKSEVAKRQSIEIG